MPEYLAPGVYVEEIPTGNKPIEGVSTSTAGFIGVTERGPVNVPQLVTSYGEFRRVFGEYLPSSEFSNGGRSHAYLPHAVEGFFLNGGKRAYVTRVLPGAAPFAGRDLFFADSAVATPGASVLLRTAQQGSGTAVSLPLIYVLDVSGLGVNDWIRIGDGSRAEYRQVAGPPGAVQRHVSLDFPLHREWPAGTAVDAGPIVPDGVNYAASPVFTQVTPALAGATEVLVTGPDAATLRGLPGPGGTQLLLFRAAGAPNDDGAEYAVATAAGGAGAQAQLTLATPLRRAYAVNDEVVAIDVPTGTLTNLSLGANGGDSLLYLDNVGGNFVEVTPPVPGTERALVIRLDGAVAEVHGIGQLATLRLRVPTYAVYPAGTVGDLVTAADDDRTIQGALGVGTVIRLDSVAGLAVGMTLVFDIGPGENGIIDAIDAGAVPPQVTLRAPLTVAPATAAVRVPPKTLTAPAPANSLCVALGNRLGIDAGDVIRLGTDEIAIVREVAGERGAPPDAGALILEQPLRRELPAGTQVRRQNISVDAVRQRVSLVLRAAADAPSVLVTDGTRYGAGEVLRLSLPDTTQVYHRLDANAVPENPREVELSAALERGHDAALPVVERSPLLELRALDAGSWGNRLLASASGETRGLVPDIQVVNANPPPGAGMFSSLELSSVTGVEPGTVLEVLRPDGAPAGLALLKVRQVDRPNRLALLDAPGLQPAHMTAHNNAVLAGTNLRVRSREFSLAVYVRQRPDPAVPTRSDNLLDQEVFRHLSMDPRHSRYVMRIVGATWTPGSPDDDLGVPLRRWDRRSEGASSYVRVLDLEANAAAREAIRLGPETLVDTLASGLTRPARHPFAGGNDAIALMGDAMYEGSDDNEPDLRTGIYTLKNLLNVSLVAIPGQTSAGLQQRLIAHCEEMRYRFAVLDGPPPPNDTLVDIQNHRQQYDTKYAALYHPWLTIPDPFPTSLASVRQYPIPPSGHVLGVFAWVDNERGVHKPPANEVVRGITGFTRYFTKGEQEILNPFPVNINVLRDFRINNRGLRIWGARCITSDSDYKYVNVRRLMIFLEDSIDRGLQWVVFEPNAEELWARVRRAVTNFLTTVWRNGALEGARVEQAFFVKCDRTTMTRDDIDNGRLICVIGVAPVKPAEFVIIRIGLWTAGADA